MLKENLIASGQDVNYYVTVDEDSEELRFGVSASVIGDKTDVEAANRLFFTEKEAEACCRWLAKNDVYPVTLNEVLHDLYFEREKTL